MPAVERVLLDRSRQAAQRAERLAFHDGVFGALRGVARLVGGERHDGIELGIERCDHRKMRVEHFNRADGARAE